MPIELAELDQLQADYKAAVENWIAAIRHEEELATTDLSLSQTLTQIDAWEHAGDSEEAARNKAKAAKKVYENGLRERFFNF